MVVFDLDFTLWRPGCQLSSGPPFTVSSDGCVITRRGERMELFPAARKSLRELADNNVPIAIASRAGEVEWAEEIMRLMRVDDARTMADVIGEAPVVIKAAQRRGISSILRTYRACRCVICYSSTMSEPTFRRWISSA